MRKTTGSRIIKLLSLAAVLVLMLALCGCRTRITNNNEVSDVMYDEDGNMQSEYDMRRDELSLSTAPKPVFTGFGRASDEEEDYDDEDMSAFDDYDPDAEEEDSELEETEENASGAGTSSKGNQSRVKKRSAVSRKNTADAEITVKFDPTDGKCDTEAIQVKKGGTYGALPKAERDGYVFEGWFTKKTGGTQVTAETPVKASANHTLYAHWTEESKIYNVSFDLNDNDDIGTKAEFTSGGEPITVESGRKYGALPTVKREKAEFDGWYTSAEGGSRVSEGDPFKGESGLTLFAHWKKEDPYKTWTKTFDEEAGSVKDEEKFGCYIEDPSDAEKNTVSECKGNVLDAAESDKVFYIIRFIKKIDGDKATAAFDEINANPAYEGKTYRILLIDSAAVDGDNNTKLAYKLIMLNMLYGKPDDTKLAEAISDLGCDPALINNVYEQLE